MGKGAGEMAPQLRALAALEEDLGLVHNHPKLQIQGTQHPLLTSLVSCSYGSHTQQTHPYIKKKYVFIFKYAFKTTEGKKKKYWGNFPTITVL